MHGYTRSALRAIVVVASVMCFAHTASVAAMKYHQVAVDHAGIAVAEFTTMEDVESADDPYPFAERVLYKDDVGRLIVIRRSMPTSTTDATKYTCLATSETLEVDTVLDESLTMTFGGQSVLIRAADLDRSATELPKRIAAQVAAAVQGLSAACRDALHRLVEIGTFYSVEFNADAGELGGLLFPDVPHVNPRGDDLIAPRRNIVNPFDPNQTPPDPFEQQFGNAYYQ